MNWDSNTRHHHEHSCTPYPLEHKKTYATIMPHIVYIETLGDAMAPRVYEKIRH